MKRFSALLTLVLAVLFAASPFFTSPFSGFRADQLPVPQIDPPVQPAGYAFAIWGLIYGWLIVSAGFGLWRRKDAADWHRARLALCLSLALGVPWLAIANASAIWATITIFIMAASAVLALINAPQRDRWMFQAPTAIYAGWLTAASCVSLATTMAGYGVLTDAFGWALIGILTALVLAIMVARQRPTAPEYLCTVIWALIGIVVANTTAQPIVTGLATAGILTLSATIWRNARLSAQPPASSG